MVRNASKSRREGRRKGVGRGQERPEDNAGKVELWELKVKKQRRKWCQREGREDKRDGKEGPEYTYNRRVYDSRAGKNRGRKLSCEARWVGPPPTQFQKIEPKLPLFASGPPNAFKRPCFCTPHPHPLFVLQASFICQPSGGQWWEVACAWAEYVMLHSIVGTGGTRGTKQTRPDEQKCSTVAACIAFWPESTETQWIAVTSSKWYWQISANDCLSYQRILRCFACLCFGALCFDINGKKFKRASGVWNYTPFPQLFLSFALPPSSLFRVAFFYSRLSSCTGLTTFRSQWSACVRAASSCIRRCFVCTAQLARHTYKFKNSQESCFIFHWSWIFKKINPLRNPHISSLLESLCPKMAHLPDYVDYYYFF